MIDWLEICLSAAATVLLLLRSWSVRSQRRACLDSCNPEAKSIADYRYGAQAHRRRCNDGAQEKSKSWIQHTGGHRNADDVVNERQHEILADVSHGGAT